MTYPLEPPIEPMLAALAREIPTGDGWLYEPKWDGFRALIFRDGDRVTIGSRNQLPLERYFPEIVSLVLTTLPPRCVIDGEIILPGSNGLDFEALQQRLHPAASRVARLARETPACLVAFDLLADETDRRSLGFGDRRALLVDAIAPSRDVFVSPQTDDAARAREWFVRFEGAGLDGIVAKRVDAPYAPGARIMVKVKHQRTADCVVGAYRMAKGGDGVGSLLLGLYDDARTMHHVGFAASFTAAKRRELVEILAPYRTDVVVDGYGFGGGSRWNQGKEVPWISLRPELVCEVTFDHLQGARFRHGTHVIRWRTDKEPEQCTFEQFVPPQPFDLDDVRALNPRAPDGG